MHLWALILIICVSACNCLNPCDNLQRSTLYPLQPEPPTAEDYCGFPYSSAAVPLSSAPVITFSGAHSAENNRTSYLAPTMVYAGDRRTGHPSRIDCFYTYMWSCFTGDGEQVEVVGIWFNNEVVTEEHVVVNLPNDYIVPRTAVLTYREKVPDIWFIVRYSDASAIGWVLGILCLIAISVRAAYEMAHRGQTRVRK